jgi:NAD(P)H-hydrate epimerase
MFLPMPAWIIKSIVGSFPRYRALKKTLIAFAFVRSFLSTMAMSASRVSFVNSLTAKAIDDDLMRIPGYSIDQLMELAGYSVAKVAFNLLDVSRKGDFDPRIPVVVFCGPGNNGGDGLVAARHLKIFGLNPIVVYPKPSKSQLFVNLVHQCVALNVPVRTDMDLNMLNSYSLIVDALFGFSFQGPPREPFKSIIQSFAQSSSPILSIDIPSGWDVDSGDIYSTNFVPHAVVSLTLPKLCMLKYEGLHFLGGR